MAGVLAAAAAVFLSGPRPLVKAARSLGVGALVVGLAGAVQGAIQSGFQFDPTQGGGQGSLLATGGMLLLTFGAAKSAERKRLRLEQDRRAAERERAKAARLTAAAPGNEIPPASRDQPIDA